MGKYAIEFSDGKGGLRRTVELSGQGETTSVSQTSVAAIMIVVLQLQVACVLWLLDVFFLAFDDL